MFLSEEQGTDKNGPLHRDPNSHKLYLLGVYSNRHEAHRHADSVRKPGVDDPDNAISALDEDYDPNKLYRRRVQVVETPLSTQFVRTSPKSNEEEEEEKKQKCVFEADTYIGGVD